MNDSGEPLGREPGEVRIVETTVGVLGERRVGAGNIWPSQYTLPDGSEATGMTAQLFVLGGGPSMIVGPGSELDLDGERWVVTAVEKPDDRSHGWVILSYRP